MMNFAIVFPGQGSQSVGMLKELAQEQSVVNSIFVRASKILDYDLWELAQKGPQEKLDKTEFTQPALLAADVAVFECWKQLGGPTPAFMAGHSLGEYAALVCAQALPFEEAIQLVSQRGKYMQEAVATGEGAMAAIIGLDEAQVKEVCQEASEGEVLSPANYNSKGQIVVAGQVNAVERAIVLAKEKGAKIAKRIPVSVPSHCSLMQPAADRLAKALESATIFTPTIPVIQNENVATHNDPKGVRQALIAQLVNPVRWVETIEAMVNQGVNLFIESGPGKVLAGLNKRIVKEGKTLSINSEESIAAAIALLKE